MGYYRVERKGRCGWQIMEQVNTVAMALLLALTYVEIRDGAWRIVNAHGESVWASIDGYQMAAAA